MTAIAKIEFQDQKSLAGWLDRAADRADMIDREPATQKQCWFLAGLILKAGEDGSEWIISSGAMLTKRHASTLIDEYLKG